MPSTNLRLTFHFGGLRPGYLSRIRIDSRLTGEGKPIPVGRSGRAIAPAAYAVTLPAEPVA